MNKAKVSMVTLYWWATEPGTHDVTLSLDPTQLYEDPDRSDNTYTFSFTVDERPVEPMLRFQPGASRTTPDIPVPGAPYSIKVRVDNLGQTDAATSTSGWSVSSRRPDGSLKDQSLCPPCPRFNHDLRLCIRSV